MAPNFYDILGGERSAALAKDMLNIPDNSVWIHENSLCNVVGIKGGVSYGKREVMTYLLQGIKKGMFGNKRSGSTELGYSSTLNEHDPNEYNINMSYQNYGVRQVFDGGLLQTDESISRARWFRKGTPYTDVKTQNKIVNALIGNEKGLTDEKVSRRRNNFAAFIRNDGTDDAGYERNDVMGIIYEYEDELDICYNKSGRYEPADLERVKDVLRLMIVASGKTGKLEVRNGVLVSSKSVRAVRGDTQRATTQQTAVVTPAVKKRAAEENTSPDAIKFTPPKTDGALKLESIRSTKDGYINFKKVDELSSLELLFQLYTTNSKLEEAEKAMEKAIEQMSELNVNLPKTFDANSLAFMSSQEINASKQNIQKAKQEAIECLQGHFVPGEDTQLYKWIADSHAYTSGCAVQTPCQRSCVWWNRAW